MATNLTRACHACKVAKRRCGPRLPKCDRCSKKTIACIYDLEPVERVGYSTYAESDQVVTPYGNVTSVQVQSSQQQPSTTKFVYCSASAAFEAVVSQNGHPSASHLAQSALHDETLMSYWISVLKENTSEKPSPFLHASLLARTILSIKEGSDTHPGIPEMPPSARDLYLEHRHDSQLDHMTLQEKLLTVHGLYSLIMDEIILVGNPPRTGNGQHLIDQYFAWVNALWSSGPEELNTTPYTPWETWCLAESIRRAFFSAYTVRSIFEACTQGYTNYIAFVETLPFDPRQDLWKAAHEPEWLAAVAKHGNVETQLVSWHELVTQAGSKLNPEWDGPFQRLLFTGYHGAQAMQNPF